jgi:hypothetical protein
MKEPVLWQYYEDRAPAPCWKTIPEHTVEGYNQRGYKTRSLGVLEEFDPVKISMPWPFPVGV